MFIIMVDKKTGYLSIVTKGSKKYKKMKYICKEYKESLNKKLLEIECNITNQLIMN